MPSPLTIIFHSIIAIVLSAIGIYVWVEKKMIVSGKLTGHLYELHSPGHIIMAFSFFILAVFFILVLMKNEAVKKLCQWLLILALVMFAASLFF